MPYNYDAFKKWLGLAEDEGIVPEVPQEPVATTPPVQSDVFDYNPENVDVTELGIREGLEKVANAANNVPSASELYAEGLQSQGFGNMPYPEKVKYASGAREQAEKDVGDIYEKHTQFIDEHVRDYEESLKQYKSSLDNDLAVFNKALDAATAKHAAAVDQLAAMPDKSVVWANRSTFSKVAGLAAAILGGYFLPTLGKNPGLEAIERMLERDMREHQAAVAKKRDFVNIAMEGVKTAKSDIASAKSDAAHELALRWRSIEQTFNVEAEKTQSAEKKALALANAAEAGMRAAKLEEDWYQKQLENARNAANDRFNEFATIEGLKMEKKRVGLGYRQVEAQERGQTLDFISDTLNRGGQSVAASEKLRMEMEADVRKRAVRDPFTDPGYQKKERKVIKHPITGEPITTYEKPVGEKGNVLYLSEATTDAELQKKRDAVKNDSMFLADLYRARRLASALGTNNFGYLPEKLQGIDRRELAAMTEQMARQLLRNWGEQRFTEEDKKGAMKSLAEAQTILQSADSVEMYDRLIERAERNLGFSIRSDGGADEAINRLISSIHNHAEMEMLRYKGEASRGEAAQMLKKATTPKASTREIYSGAMVGSAIPGRKGEYLTGSEGENIRNIIDRAVSGVAGSSEYKRAYKKLIDKGGVYKKEAERYAKFLGVYDYLNAVVPGE